MEPTSEPAVSNGDGKPKQQSPKPTQAPDASPARQPNANPRPARAPFDGNVVFVGKKEPMSYVLTLVGRFNAGASSLELKARGRTISKAVDVTQILKNRFMPDLRIGNVLLATEQVENEDGSKSRVSSMTVTLSK